LCGNLNRVDGDEFRYLGFGVGVGAGGREAKEILLGVGVRDGDDDTVGILVGLGDGIRSDGIAVPSSLIERAVKSAIKPATTNARAAAGPASSAAVAGRTKMPAPIIVPAPMVNAARRPSSFDSSVSVLIQLHPQTPINAFVHFVVHDVQSILFPSLSRLKLFETAMG